jgi:hypothetical protein
MAWLEWQGGGVVGPPQKETGIFLGDQGRLWWLGSQFLLSGLQRAPSSRGGLCLMSAMSAVHKDRSLSKARTKPHGKRRHPEQAARVF